MIIVVSVQKSKFKRISIIIITVLFIYSAVSMLVTKLVYDRIFDRYDTQVPVPQALSEMTAQRQVVHYPSGENTLTGYYYPAQQENPYGLAVLVPGFHAGADNYLWQIQSLQDSGWAVFSFDPTGTFQSQGDSQIGFSQILIDLEATLNYIEKNHSFGYNELVLIGHSRGGYAACCVLSQNFDISAVVCVSGINSAMESVMEISTQKVGPIAYCNYGYLWLYQSTLFGRQLLNQQASEAISQSDIPVLVVHGTQDQDAEESSVIAHKAQIASDKVEYLYCVAGHTDLLYDSDGTANDQLMADIQEFLLRSIDR